MPKLRNPIQQGAQPLPAAAGGCRAGRAAGADRAVGAAAVLRPRPRARRTFAEQVEGLTVRYARRTPLLRSMLEQVAVALGGRAGARLTRALQATTSRSTLLRLLRALPDPKVDQVAVLGVDNLRSGVAAPTAPC
jgi:hypothetical protein